MASQEKINEFSDLFALIRPYGWYQLFTLFVVQYTCINAAGNFFLMTFAGMKPNVWCDGRQVGHQCDLSALNCTLLEQQSSFRSLYDDYDFACQYDFVPGLITTLQMIAAGLGEVIGGHIADYFGRKYVVYSGYTALLIVGVVAGLSTSWQLLSVCVVAMGFFHGVQTTAFFTLTSETAGKRFRIVQACAFQWSLAFQVVALAAYLTQDWRKYVLLINVICVPVLGLLLLLKESPRWLIQHRRLKQAADVLNQIAKFNRRDVIFTAEDLSEIDVFEKKTRCTVLDLVSTRRFRLYCLAMGVAAVSCECIPGVFMFNVQALAGSPFLNIALYGILRLWTPVFLILVEQKTKFFGRRATFIISQGTVSLCFLGIVLIFATGRFETLRVLATVLAQLGAVVNVGMSWVVYKQYVTELFPTVMRGIALGTFSVLAIAGMALAPQLVYLAKFWPGTPYAGAGFLSLLSLILGFCILPETKDRPLPDVLRSVSEDKQLKEKEMNLIVSKDQMPNENGNVDSNLLI